MQIETLEMEIKHIKEEVDEVKSDVKEIKNELQGLLDKLDERYPTRREFKSVVWVFGAIATMLWTFVTILSFIK